MLDADFLPVLKHELNRLGDLFLNAVDAGRVATVRRHNNAAASLAVADTALFIRYCDKLRLLLSHALVECRVHRSQLGLLVLADRHLAECVGSRLIPCNFKLTFQEFKILVL